MRKAAALALGALVVAGGSTGCGGGDDSGGSPDGAPGAGRAVVFGLNGDSADAIVVMTLQDGMLTEVAGEMPVNNPSSVAIRSDGAEALVSYGGFGDPYGVVVVELSNGGAEAHVVDTVEVGTGDTPFGLAYTSDDHAVLALASGDPDGKLVALDRSGDSFAAGTTTTIPNNWALEAVGRPGHDEALLLRQCLGTDAAADLFHLTRSGADWSTGTPGQIAGTVIDVRVHPGGDVAYSPTGDPDDPVSVDNLDAGGLLHVAAIDGASPVDGTPVKTPGIGSFVAVDPGGQFLVMEAAIYEDDPDTGTPIVRNYDLYTFPLDGSGTPGAPLGPTAQFPGLLFNGFALAPTGELITSMVMYEGTTPPAQQYPVQVWTQATPGDWQVAQTVFPAGQTVLAIAP